MNNYNLDSNAIFISNLFGEKSTFSIQSVNLPGVSVAHERYPSRKEVLNPVIAFEGLTFPPLTMTLVLDEDMSNWLEFTRLIMGVRKEEIFNEFKDGILIIRQNNGQSGVRVVFANIVVTSISDIEYSTTSTNEEQKFTIEVQYDWFDVSGVFKTTEGDITVEEFEKEIEDAYKRKENEDDEV